MAEAIAEAEAEETMEEMEDARTPTIQEMYSRRLDGLYISPGDMAAGLANTSEGKDARHARAEEILRGKQPMTTPSQQEREREHTAITRACRQTTSRRSFAQKHYEG